MTPSKWLLIWFLGLILVGSGALLAPIMTPDGISFVDAIFTATTAVCVTGLMVLDLQTDFTPWGQAVILALIQLGGIGIVTFASFLILSSRTRLTITQEEMLSATVAVSPKVNVRQVTIAVLIFTFAIEAVGTALLYAVWPGDAMGTERLWHAAFHAISAFCNAGISLFSRNMEGFTSAVGVNVVMMTLIILGGFGFTNFQELRLRLASRTFRWRSFSVFLKVSIVLTIALNVVGAAAILALEYANAFAALDKPDKFLAAMFQSVTTRTAGFNTVAMGSFTDLTMHIFLILMFIGAVGGSCAGGIKLGTVAVLFAMYRAYLRNIEEPILFNRRIPLIDRRKATVLFMASIMAIIAGFVALSISEGQHGAMTDLRGALFPYAFEVVSALGTVGLSTGITPSLSPSGKSIIIILMIVGRLGPLAIIAAWAAGAKPLPYTAPEEPIAIG